MIEDLGIDILICPSAPHCAFRISESDDLATQAYYFLIWNLLNYPAGVVPITEVTPEEEVGYDDRFNDIITNKLRQSMQGSAGMPIGLQVVAPKWEDEKCLAAMKILDDAVKYRK
mmetsp:Transcript_27475/g.20634  ORF Transcript_27475/g.20634 Transcript_27475/m.20634 type:complete len:115 (+) Transcript_27475:574-918(+)